MAGIAALMSKRKRQKQKKQQDLELTAQFSVYTDDGVSLSEHLPYTSSSTAGRAGEGSQSQTPSKLKKAVGVSALKQSFGSKDFSHLRTSKEQMETPARETTTKDTSKKEDGSFETNPGPSYNAVYIGLVICSLGLVISFVGLGDKGFKTTELRLIGPILCIVGVSCVIFKILQCNFPRLFTWTSMLKRSRKKVDQSNLAEKGLRNGHVNPSSTKGTPQGQTVPQRVTLQSSKRPPRERPTSTIPNYIDDTSDEDDFDPGRSKAHTNPFSSYEKQREQRSQQVQKQKSEDDSNNEVVLNPKSLML